jgi:Bacterial PH domain
VPPAVQIRTTRVALLPVAVGAICLSPVALLAPWTLPLFAVPLVLALWVARAGVDVDADGLTVRALVGARRVRWLEVAGLRVSPRGGVALVLAGGGALRLPAVRARHLPLIAAASNGHLPDPTKEVQ